MDMPLGYPTSPQLETERLLLRQLRAEDAEAVFGILSDRAVARFYNQLTPIAVDQVRRVIRERNDLREAMTGIWWGVVLREEEQVVGGIGIHGWDPGQYRAQVGYELASAFWGRGIMTEALRAVVRFGFERLALNRIEAEVMPENAASTRLLERLGFVAEGVLRERGCWKGGFHDLQMFSLLRADWRRGQSDAATPPAPG